MDTRHGSSSVGDVAAAGFPTSSWGYTVSTTGSFEGSLLQEMGVSGEVLTHLLGRQRPNKPSGLQRVCADDLAGSWWRRLLLLLLHQTNLHTYQGGGENAPKTYSHCPASVQSFPHTQSIPLASSSLPQPS